MRYNNNFTRDGIPSESLFAIFRQQKRKLEDCVIINDGQRHGNRDREIVPV